MSSQIAAKNVGLYISTNEDDDTFQPDVGSPDTMDSLAKELQSLKDAELARQIEWQKSQIKAAVDRANSVRPTQSLTSSNSTSAPNGPGFARVYSKVTTQPASADSFGGKTPQSAALEDASTARRSLLSEPIDETSPGVAGIGASTNGGTVAPSSSSAAQKSDTDVDAPPQRQPQQDQSQPSQQQQRGPTQSQSQPVTPLLQTTTHPAAPQPLNPYAMVPPSPTSSSSFAVINAIKDMQARMNAESSLTAQLQQQLKAQSARISTLELSLKAESQKVQVLERVWARIDAVQANVAQLTGRIDALDRQIGHRFGILESAMAAQSDTSAEHVGKLSKIMNEIKHLQDEAKAAHKQAQHLADLQAQVSKQTLAIDGVRERLDQQIALWKQPLRCQFCPIMHQEGQGQGSGESSGAHPHKTGPEGALSTQGAKQSTHLSPYVETTDGYKLSKPAVLCDDCPLVHCAGCAVLAHAAHAQAVNAAQSALTSSALSSQPSQIMHRLSIKSPGGLNPTTRTPSPSLPDPATIATATNAVSNAQIQGFHNSLAPLPWAAELWQLVNERTKERFAALDQLQASRLNALKARLEAWATNFEQRLARLAADTQPLSDTHARVTEQQAEQAAALAELHRQIQDIRSFELSTAGHVRQEIQNLSKSIFNHLIGGEFSPNPSKSGGKVGTGSTTMAAGAKLSIKCITCDQPVKTIAGFATEAFQRACDLPNHAALLGAVKRSAQKLAPQSGLHLSVTPGNPLIVPEKDSMTSTTGKHDHKNPERRGGYYLGRSPDHVQAIMSPAFKSATIDVVPAALNIHRIPPRQWTFAGSLEANTEHEPDVEGSGGSGQSHQEWPQSGDASANATESINQENASTLASVAGGSEKAEDEESASSKAKRLETVVVEQEREIYALKNQFKQLQAMLELQQKQTARFSGSSPVGLNLTSTTPMPPVPPFSFNTNTGRSPSPTGNASSNTPASLVAEATGASSARGGPTLPRLAKTHHV